MPTLTSPAKQQTWDKPIVQLELSQLMERHTDTYDKGQNTSILALVSERSTMSLRWLCRVRRPEVCLHDSACDPLTSTTGSTNTHVRFADVDAKTKADGYPHDFIIQSQPAGGDEDGM